MTIQLRTGQVQPSRPEHYITKRTAVAPAPPGTPHPQWSAFLDTVTGGRPELASYLQRVAGYCLTGEVKEHVLFFLHGTGANGKSVFVNTLVDIWHDYACTIGTDMLMVSNTDRHPTEIARLRGVRLAVGSEIEIGRTWAESKIKALTGGDRLQGRFMRQDFFEFDPQFKLLVVGNNKPSLRGVDEAIRRRLHLIPFTVTIPEQDRDPDLPEKLRAEWPAILRWAIDGCLMWQRNGLTPPALVTDATEEYLEAEDATALWLDDCTESDPNAWEAASSLFASWKRWAERTGEFVGTQKRLGQTLRDRGLSPKREPGTGIRGYLGLRLTDTGQGDRWEP
jgi:putative DNA primase/helicase